ncbi:type II toxin-antitoxin system RelE/ParE family toxin [Nitrosomonas sp. JL21]|uniref:type II toxin-antitoxin system RelE/ParE family toxin n=1 Tax=Nitrosomonas sp. JL21 TaxID=153949 RepID=UPI00136F00B9|nr:type II toxin-antitoxin system RelE/ParE family toxin [Nitrosomonas sp.]
MGRFHLTDRAVTDLSDIADFTIQSFGIEQARFYRDGLNNCFDILADNPQLGQSATELAPSLKRFEYQSHVVFYKSQGADILIVRILHQRMDFIRHIPSSKK